MHKIPYKNPEGTFLRGLIEYRNYVLAIDRLIVIDPLIIKDGLFPKTSRIVTQKMLISPLHDFLVNYTSLSVDCILKSSNNRFRVTKKLNRFLVTVIFFVCFLLD